MSAIDVKLCNLFRGDSFLLAVQTLVMLAMDGKEGYAEVAGKVWIPSTCVVCMIQVRNCHSALGKIPSNGCF